MKKLSLIMVIFTILLASVFGQSSDKSIQQLADEILILGKPDPVHRPEAVEYIFFFVEARRWDEAIRAIVSQPTRGVVTRNPSRLRRFIWAGILVYHNGLPGNDMTTIENVSADISALKSVYLTAEVAGANPIFILSGQGMGSQEMVNRANKIADLYNLLAERIP
jgi:hypothetical protein